MKKKFIYIALIILILIFSFCGMAYILYIVKITSNKVFYIFYILFMAIFSLLRELIDKHIFKNKLISWIILILTCLAGFCILGTGFYFEVKNTNKIK